MSIEVLSPMPGTILNILVQEGDRVSEDQEVLILESMKMENPIFAPQAGSVKSIRVKTGDTVTSRQVLMQIE